MLQRPVPEIFYHSSAESSRLASLPSPADLARSPRSGTLPAGRLDGRISAIYFRNRTLFARLSPTGNDRATGHKKPGAESAGRVEPLFCPTTRVISRTARALTPLAKGFDNKPTTRRTPREAKAAMIRLVDSFFCGTELWNQEAVLKLPASSRARAKKRRSRRENPPMRGEQAQPGSRRTGGFDQRRPALLQPCEDRWEF